MFSTLSSDVAAGGSKYQRFYIGEQLIEWSIKPGFHWGWTEDSARKKATKLLHRRIQSNTRSLPIAVINPESIDL